MEILARLFNGDYAQDVQSEQNRQRWYDFFRETLHIANLIIPRIDNKEEPYSDKTIREIIEGCEEFRTYHPVSLFSAIQFIDELAQIIKPKRIAEMDEDTAWPWEMKRVIDRIIIESYKEGVSDNPLLADMSRRITAIITEERRKYQQ